MDKIRQDVRFALRAIRRTPAVFATAIVILGLGIGMSVAMFTVFRAVVVRKLPVVDQDRVAVMWTYHSDPNADLATGTKDLSVVRRESRTMREIAGIAHWPATSSPFKYGDRGVELKRGMVTGNFFDVLGARPALGRLLRPSDDETPGVSSTARSKKTGALVLGYRAWREKFGGDSAVIGRHLIEPLLGIDYLIVGVAPPGLEYPIGVEYWIPMWDGWQSAVQAFAVARLALGATVGAAQREYLAIEQRLQPALQFRGAHAATFTETVLGDVQPVLALLTAAVALLLLIACLNVGNLLLLRASSRARELAVRRALGASLGDIVRQLSVEAAAIGVGGGVLGLVLSVALLRALVSHAPPNLPRLDDVQLSGAPVASAMLISFIAVLIAGVGPSLVSGRANLALSLRLDARTSGETRRRRSMRQGLVAAQVGLAMIMLSGAALLARSLARLEGQDLGFRSEHLSILWYSWNAKKQDSVPKMVALGEQLTRRVRAIPGIEAATEIVVSPMLGNGIWIVKYVADGQSDADGSSNVFFTTELGSPELFKTLGIPIVRGRAFTEADRDGAPLVAIVSEGVARRLWPNENPIGRTLRIPGATRNSILGADARRTIVGVARDTRLRTLRDSSPTVYLPANQSYWQGSIAIRSRVSLATLLPALREAGHDVDSDLEVWDPRTMDEVLDGPLAQPRLGALLMSSFGLVALLLAAIGLYGVMASLVRDRTREIGIRVALGATPARVRNEVLGRSARIAGIGAAIGLVAALALSRGLGTVLYQISPSDPIALGAAGVVLLVVGTAAAYFPARRATRIDPALALRAE